MQSFSRLQNLRIPKKWPAQSLLFFFGNKAFQPSVWVSTFLVSQPLTFYLYFLYTGQKKNADTSLDSLGIIHAGCQTHVEERLDLGFRSARFAIAQSHRAASEAASKDTCAALAAAFWSSLRISLNELASKRHWLKACAFPKAASHSPEPSLKFPLSEPRPIGWDRRCPSISKVKQKKHWLRTYVAKADDWSALIFHGFGWNPVPSGTRFCQPLCELLRSAAISAPSSWR